MKFYLKSVAVFLTYGLIATYGQHGEEHSGPTTADKLHAAQQVFESSSLKDPKAALQELAQLHEDEAQAAACVINQAKQLMTSPMDTDKQFAEFQDFLRDCIPDSEAKRELEEFIEQISYTEAPARSFKLLLGQIALIDLSSQSEPVGALIRIVQFFKRSLERATSLNETPPPALAYMVELIAADVEGTDTTQDVETQLAVSFWFLVNDAKVYHKQSSDDSVALLLSMGFENMWEYFSPYGEISPLKAINLLERVRRYLSEDNYDFDLAIHHFRHDIQVVESAPHIISRVGQVLYNTDTAAR